MNFSRATGKRARRITYQDLKRHVEVGGAVIVLGPAHDNPRYHHYFLLTDIVPCSGERTRFFRAINFHGGARRALVSWWYMKQLIADSMVWTFTR